MKSAQFKPKSTFFEFLKNLPDEEGYYELAHGEINRRHVTRQHDILADLIADILHKEVERLNLNYRVSGRIMLCTQTEDEQEQGRYPDITVVDKTLWESQPTAYSALLDPPQLAVEVVSTNWEDDYIDKLAEYQHLGIVEYWIVDYLAIGSRTYLGNPKQPTIFIFTLDDKGVYQMQAYRESDRLVSPTFPKLNLTVSEIFDELK
ncbi:MAG: Uma2 family endonuclease [Cyanobacteria bacterium P01_E01_bin.42]